MRGLCCQPPRASYGLARLNLPCSACPALPAAARKSFLPAGAAQEDGCAPTEAARWGRKGLLKLCCL